MNADAARNSIEELGRRARAAARVLARSDTAARNRCLASMADALVRALPAIRAANARDLSGGREAGLSAAMLDRLMLDEARIGRIASDVRAVAALPDPVGEEIRNWTPPNGLHISQVRVPIGVIGIIYESRPNVTCDAASLCLKAGNAVILRGGSEALQTNQALAAALREGCTTAGLPADCVKLVDFADRAAVQALCEADKFIDLLIPRGGRGLIETVVRYARMPVIKHFDGICCLYVDKGADLAMAERIAVNAKCQRPGVCNAIETLLVHADVAERFLASAGPALARRGVQLRADPRALAALKRSGLPDGDGAVPARPEDFRTEFLDLILAVRVVDGLDAAIDHIETNGSHHSDGIVTADSDAAERFLREVDSATVYWNASTRFTDGGEFGFGAEIGISTDKLHARGPMGLPELTTYKYILRGTGQVREN